MTAFKNVSGEDRLVPNPAGGSRLVLAGATLDESEFIGDPSGQESIWQKTKASKTSNNDSQEG